MSSMVRNSVALGASAFCLVRFALHKLMPRAVVSDLEVNGDFFSCLLHTPQKIGPEFREVLLEAMRSIVREELAIRPFSMIVDVLVRYLGDKHIMADEKLQSRLFGPENSAFDGRELLELVEVGEAFCMPRDAGSEYVPSTKALKWIELLELEAMDSRRFFLRGVASGNAKTSLKRKRALERFFGSVKGNGQPFFCIEKDGRKYPVITEGGTSALAEMLSQFGAAWFQFPRFIDDESICLLHPLSFARRMGQMYEESGEFLRKQGGWVGSMRTLATGLPCAASDPIAAFCETTALSLFCSAVSKAEVLSLLECLGAIYSSSHDGAFKTILEVVVSSKEKKSRDGFEEIREWLRSSLVEGEREVFCSTSPRLAAGSVVFCFSSLFVEGFERPTRRALVYIPLWRGRGKEESTTPCIVIPFLSYEREVLLRGEANFLKAHLAAPGDRLC